MPSILRPRAIVRARGSLVALALLVSSLFMPARARAQGFHAVDVELLYGSRFHDDINGNATRSGAMSTVTFESISASKIGDSFFFIDLTSGDFANGPTGSHRMYGEFAPRLSLSKISGKSIAAGPIEDVLVAGSMDRGGNGFAANLIGLGTDLRVPGFSVAQLDLYRRQDSFNKATYQVTGVWRAPVNTGRLAWTLAGFTDVAGTDVGTDVMTQPQLLLDLGSVIGRSTQLRAGVEWYLHHSPVTSTTSSAPQAMLMWSW